MDCQAARLLFWFNRPQAKELLPADEAALAHHLAECPTCARLARVLAQEDRRIGSAIRDVAVPAGLMAGVLTALDHSRVAATALRRRRWGWGLVGAVALCLLVTGGAVAWWHWQPTPAASVRELEWWALNRFSLPAHTPAPEKWAWLEQFFYSQQVQFQVPATLKRRWDFAHLATAYVADFSHDRVAVMEFRKPGAHAFVFVIPSAHCTTDDWRDFQPSADSTTLLRMEPDEGFVCLAVLKEGTLDQFLLPTP